MKFKTCIYCGSNLDFGEKCDCGGQSFKLLTEENKKEAKKTKKKRHKKQK